MVSSAMNAGQRGTPSAGAGGAVLALTRGGAGRGLGEAVELRRVLEIDLLHQLVGETHGEGVVGLVGVPVGVVAGEEDVVDERAELVEKLEELCWFGRLFHGLGG